MSRSVASSKLKTKTAAASAARPDGRRLRTEDSRRRVVAALLECVRDGDFDPNAETVAFRAGVGLRTVFRLFTDKEGLYREMSEAIRAQLAVLASTPLKGETWRERLDDLVRRRCIAFEKIMPYRRAGQAHVHQSPMIRANYQELQDTLRKILAAILPAAVLTDRPTFEALDMALSTDIWIRLRIDQGLKPPQARATLQRLVSVLLAGFPA